MAYISTNMLFRDLDDMEEEKFREWARNNNSKDWESKMRILHPVVLNEWERLNPS